ncbi:acyl-CoA dehydrogenase family protein [Novosphingobium malaysiense]|uniref:Acyl-CoA dehydrogenase n=1 Tax=Novosphingobium malaysiense TaxID=1348853 RepID=A0A0B1ZEQ2_9SPHN|nr:acyl-CoA dehydrogenase family protein [Novosphingobium malaysiense]KHK88985.1 hypothetical protein LK12_23140 [Novosphingobium malaysiense]
MELSEVLEDDLELLVQSIEDVLSNECGSQALHKFYDGENALDTDLWRQASDLGWLAIGLTEELGGLEMGYRGLDVLHRALGRAGAPGGFIPTLVGAQWLSQVADERLLQELMPRFVAGELEFAVPAALGGVALEERDGFLSGTSSLLMGGSETCVAIVPVGVVGGRGFAVVEADGRTAVMEPAELWDRTRPAGKLVCNQAKPLALIADADGAVARCYLSNMTLAVAADCVGAARRIAGQTVDYLKERVQFGKPLATLQALKHRCADLFLKITPAEDLLNHAVDAASRADRSALMWCALAKAAASDAFRFVAADCVQLHGGVGHTWEFDCHIFLKRALLNEELGGRNAILRDLAAEELNLAAMKGISTMEIAA